MKLSREMEASRFLCKTYQFLNTGNSFRAANSRLKYCEPILGGLWPLPGNITVFIMTQGPHKLFAVHRAGRQAVLTVLFIVEMGQKEAGDYWLRDVDVAGGGRWSKQAASVGLGLSKRGWRPSSDPA